MLAVMKDQDLRDSLEYLLSALLPHENYDPSIFSAITQSVFEHVSLDEMQMEYWVLFALMRDLRSLQISSNAFTPRLTRDRLENNLDNRAMELVFNPDVGVREWSSANGHSFNPSSEEDTTLASQRLFERTLDLYDRAFEMKVDSLSALTILPTLKEQIISNIAYSSLEAQPLILQGAHTERVGKKRKTYTGGAGWREYIKDVEHVLQTRLEKASVGVRHLNSMEEANMLKQQWKLLYDPLAYYNIAPFDQGVPMVRNWFALFCANEGVGKTALSILMARSLVRAKRDVLLMAGETVSQMIAARFVSHDIKATHGKFVTTTHLTHLDECSPEIRRLVDEALLELVHSEHLHIIPTLPYYGLYDKLKALREEFNFDAVLMDHTGVFNGGTGNETKDIGNLAVEIRRFKNDFPVFMGVFSHLSSEAKKALAEGREVTTSPAKASSVISNEADEIKLMFTNDELKRHDLVAVKTTKIRGVATNDIIFLRLYKEVSTFEYNLEDQGLYSKEKADKEAMLSLIEDETSEEGADEYALI